MEGRRLASQGLRVLRMSTPYTVQRTLSTPRWKPSRLTGLHTRNTRWARVCGASGCLRGARSWCRTPPASSATCPRSSFMPSRQGTFAALQLGKCFALATACKASSAPVRYPTVLPPRTSQTLLSYARGQPAWHDSTRSLTWHATCSKLARDGGFTTHRAPWKRRSQRICCCMSSTAPRRRCEPARDGAPRASGAGHDGRPAAQPRG